MIVYFHMVIVSHDYSFSHISYSPCIKLR